MKKYFSYNISEKNFFKIYLIILAIFSLFVNQSIANRGAFPIDSFLIFDSAFNIISGNHPFKDYWLITGPFVDYIQSLFFMTFGISWASYVLHASTLNMALALFSFYFFKKIGLNNHFAFIYSLGVAILAYPSIGSPFVDHHSVIFCVMACYSISLAFLLKKNFFWVLIPIFITFSFFSKQIPSPYFVALFALAIIIYFYQTKSISKNILTNLLIGIFVSFFLIFIIFFINEIPLKNFIIQYIYYPISLGDERISKFNIDFKNLINQFKFIYIMLFPLLISTYFLYKIKKKILIQKVEIFISIIFLSAIAIIIYCQLLTKNQILIFFLIPISAAYSHAYTIKYFNKKYLIYFILAVFIFTTAKYHIRFNEQRKFIELANVNLTYAENPIILDGRLKGLKWITPHYKNKPLNEINLLIDTKNILQNVKDEKIIITDYLFFNSLLKNKFASPNKWYDGLSIPRKTNKYYNTHKDFFISKLKENNIRHLFFIGKNKSDSFFFKELIRENECMISNQLNKLLVEFNISSCKF